MVGVYIACAFVLGLGARALGMPPLVGCLACRTVVRGLGRTAYLADGLPAIKPVVTAGRPVALCG